MTTGSKRKRATNKGLQPGERLRRDKLAGVEAEHSQWGWVMTVEHPSLIHQDNKFSACGFLDKITRPTCRNKFDGSDEPPRKKRKLSKPEGEQDGPGVVEDTDEVVIISSGEEDEKLVCTRKKCRNNPNCVNYIGQSVLENEEEALKAYLAASNLGDSPLETARVPDLPVGLKVWFQDHAFREAVYRCVHSQEDGVQNDDSPVFQLQVTFAALQESNQNVFNPVKLVESLQLRTSEQQDAQEFSKLFMTHLANEFEKQAVPSLKTLITDQFEGTLTYGTMCKKCLNKSERDSNFLELEINLESNGKLEDCIKAFLQSEELSGDNKYRCGYCDSLQDAMRYTRLRQLPPVLHFSVLRFVFDLETLSRKKSKRAILFPPVINMSSFLGNASSEKGKKAAKNRAGCSGINDPNEHIYELRGVLLHKGPSAYHGHYEAQVYDVVKKQFYQFNDEVVTPMKSLRSQKRAPEAQEANGGTSAQGKARKKNVRKNKRVDDSDGEENRKIDDYLNYTSSKDAYMLIYARRDPLTNGHPSNSLPMPPSDAQERVAELNKEHVRACKTFDKNQSKIINDFKAMREAKRNIYKRWELDNVRQESAVFSRRALESWICEGLKKPPAKSDGAQEESNTNRPVNEDVPPRRSPSHMSGKSQTCTSPSHSPDPLDSLSTNDKVPVRRYTLDNSAIACKHGALDPRKSNEMKRIKKDALCSIEEMGYQVEPQFTTEDICMSCLEEIFLEKRYALDHANHVEEFDCLYNPEETTDGTWISKAWLRDWKQPVPKMHVPGKPDPDPEAADFKVHVQCPHGRLSFTPALRKWLNGVTYVFLKSIFPTWNPTIMSAEEPPSCPACEAQLSTTKEVRQEIKQRVDREKEQLKGILMAYTSGNDSSFESDTPWALIGGDFVREWRAWMNKPYDTTRPQLIDNHWLICEHDGLVVDPSTQLDFGTAVIPIPRNDWDSLQHFYCGGPLVEWSPTADATNNSGDNKLRSVCKECRSQRLKNFVTAVISVRLLGNEDSPSAENPSKDEELNVIDVDAKQPVPVRQRNGRPIRTSNRIRSRHKGKVHDIQITRESSIKDIKVDLQDRFKIPTICQQLFYNGRELIDSSETVASLGILAGDCLELKEVQEKDGDSDMEIDNPSRPREEGPAFGGTVLGGTARKPLGVHDHPEPEPMLSSGELVEYTLS